MGLGVIGWIPNGGLRDEAANPPYGTEDLGGDVKQLTNFTPEYRLRVGDYRVLFEIEGNTIVVYGVRHRREAYR